MCFSKTAKRLVKGRKEKVKKLSEALEYVLFLHRNLLEYSWAHFTKLLYSFKCDFEEISKKFFFSNMFSTYLRGIQKIIKEPSEKLKIP